MYQRCRYLIFFIFLFSIQFNSFSQVSEEDKKLAEDYLQIAQELLEETQAMDIAREQYVLAATTDPTNVKANWLAGDFHLKTVGKQKAAQYFLQVLELDPEYRFDITYWIGQSYQFGMEYDKALAYYNRYLQKLKDKEGYRGRDRTELPEVERRIYECENAIEFTANPSHYAVKNVGGAINTEYEDFGPVVDEKETMMIFTSRRREGNLNQNVFSDNKPYEEIYISEKKNGVWTPAVNIGETVNTEFHDSNLALSADGKRLFLYKDENNGDIFESERKEDGTWSYPQSLSENINSEGFKEASISISPDQSVLFYTSDRPGGYGGIDIYYSIKDENGEWGRSKNLGEVINTEYNDDGPFIDYDGKTLYFSTQGRKGMGGYDLFKSEYDSAEGKWGEPENLGVPINTPDDEIYFVSTKDGKRGYYASVREDGQGFKDIYEITILQEDNVGDQIANKDLQDTNLTDETGGDPANLQKVDTKRDGDTADLKKTETSNESKLEPVMVTVRVVDVENQPIDAKVDMKNQGNNRVAGKSNKGNGVFEFNITEAGKTTYRISAEKSGYVFKNMDIDIPAASETAQSLTRTITLQKLELGTSSVLRNIYFNFDKATFKDESYTELNKLEGMVAQNPGLQIEISGHTDNIGSKDYNKSLSQRRAEAVKNYLLNKGIDARRVTAVGYGEEKPLASNDDEKDGRELNRRVEFRVTGGK